MRATCEHRRGGVADQADERMVDVDLEWLASERDARGDAKGRFDGAARPQHGLDVRLDHGLGLAGDRPALDAEQA